MLETLKMIFYLFIFIAILYGAYFVSKYMDKFSFGFSKSKYMKIIDKLVLTKDKSMAIVKVGEKNILVGITKDGLNIIQELHESDMIPIEDSDENPSKLMLVNDDIVIRTIKKGIGFVFNFFKQRNYKKQFAFKDILIKKIKTTDGVDLEAENTDEN